MRSSAPNGFFADGLILLGRWDKGGTAIKGFIVGPPDLRGGSVQHLNAYQDKIRVFLASLTEGMSAQLQWVGNGDFAPELTTFGRKADAIQNPQIKRRVLRQWRRLEKDAAAATAPGTPGDFHFGGFDQSFWPAS